MSNDELKNGSTNRASTSKEPEQQKSFFERLGELLNQPLPGTEIDVASASATKQADPKQVDQSTDDNEDISLLERVKEILNTPLPGTPNTKSTQDSDQTSIIAQEEISEGDFQENWWETDWATFKAHQDKDRQGLNMKQRRDQEGFAQYQERERAQFDTYQNQEFEVFQRQQQAKLNWIQEQQLAQAQGVQPLPHGMVPPPPPAPPVPPQMPVPPWVRNA